MRSRSLKFLAAAGLSLLLASGVTLAQAQMPPPASASSVAPGPSGVHLGVGVLQAIDASGGTVTIAHQAIETMGMPAMTMPFATASGLSVAGLKPGDPVTFVLEQGPLGPVLTAIRPVGTTSAQAAAPGSAHEGVPMMAMMEQCTQMMGRH